MQKYQVLICCVYLKLPKMDTYLEWILISKGYLSRMDTYLEWMLISNTLTCLRSLLINKQLLSLFLVFAV